MVVKRSRSREASVSLRLTTERALALHQEETSVIGAIMVMMGIRSQRTLPSLH
jgi:hypothetical protein